MRFIIKKSIKAGKRGEFSGFQLNNSTNPHTALIEIAAICEYSLD